MNRGCPTTVDVLVSVHRRGGGLAVTLASLLGQTWQDLRIMINDQTPEGDALSVAEVAAVVRVLRARGLRVQLAHGAAAEPTSYALCCEAGTICPPDLVERLGRVAEEPPVLDGQTVSP